MEEFLKDLGFRIGSKGFIFWIEAIEIYKKEKKPITEIYKEIAKNHLTTKSNVDYLMKYSRLSGTRKIRTYYEYNDRLTNTIVLHLLTNFK